MKIQLNTNLVPIFSGTYETFWEIEEFNDDGDAMTVVYDDNILKGIAETYKKHSDFIRKEFNIPFIKKIEFSGGFNSPAYYNFSTDTLDFNITVNFKKLLQKLNSLEHDDEFNTFLHDHYTSYDGFMSFTPNNYYDLKNEIVNRGREFTQAIGALVRYLIPDELLEGEFYSTLEGQIYEDWQGNGWGGTNYHVECWVCDKTLEYPYEHKCKKPTRGQLALV